MVASPVLCWDSHPLEERILIWGQRLDSLELFVEQSFVKIETEKASDLDIRRGQKEHPLASF